MKKFLFRMLVVSVLASAVLSGCLPPPQHANPPAPAPPHEHPGNHQ